MVKTFCRTLLVVAFALTSFFAWQLQYLRFDYDFERFFPLGDPELAFYLDFIQRFETDNDFLLLSIENQTGVFQSDFLLRLQTLEDTLKNHPWIDDLRSPLSLTRLIISPSSGVFSFPLLHPHDAGRLAADSVEVMTQSPWAGSFFSTTRPAVCLFINHKDWIKKQEADSLVAFVHSALAAHGFSNFHLVGKAVAQEVYITLIQKELFFFFVLSAVLVTLFLALTYRSVLQVIISLALVLITAVWTLGLMSLIGKSLDVLMVLLPTILFVVGMSDVVHLLTRLYRGAAQWTSSPPSPAPHRARGWPGHFFDFRLPLPSVFSLWRWLGSGLFRNLGFILAWVW
ncbi:MAG: MMPL family transporter [Cytophagales bacterium]|nr:MMPL family transporter [Cytophagales bacterium]